MNKARLLVLWTLVALLGSACGGESEGDDPGECSDGADNDRNGTFDCDDPACAGAPVCKGPTGESPTPPPRTASSSPTSKKKNDVKLVPYGNARFNFWVDRPAHFKPGPEPMNGDGLRFTGPGGGELVASGSFTMPGSTVESAFEDAKREPGLDVTYSTQKSNWFVVSGTRGSNIVYIKTKVDVITCVVQ